MITHRELDKARAVHADMGGWLLDLGSDGYLVTDDEGLVRDLRADMIAHYGEAWMGALASVEHDETKLDIGWRMDPGYDAETEHAAEAEHFGQGLSEEDMRRDQDEKIAARAPDWPVRFSR